MFLKSPTKISVILAILTISSIIFFYFLNVDSVINAQTVDELRSQIDQYEQRIMELRKEQEQLGQSISSTQDKAKTLQNEINKLNSSVKYMENQIYLTSINIDKTGTEIESLEGTIFDVQRDINYNKDTIARLMLSIYKKDNENLLTILFKNNSISDFFVELDTVASLNTALFDAIEALKSNKADLEENKNNLEYKKTDLEKLRQQQSYERSSLNHSKNESANLLKATKNQEALYQKLLTEAEQRERDANLEIFRLEEKLRQAIDPDSLPLARPGILEWPVNGRVSQRYGCIETRFARRYYPDCNNGRGGFHNGLDTAAPYGTPVVAAEDGTVIAMGNAPSAYGVWFAIEHTNGLVTAYTHLSVRHVSVGQGVKRGEVIAKMGSTGLSTGSHIHFMVYAPKTFTVQSSRISGTLPIGATLNPADYLE